MEFSQCPRWRSYQPVNHVFPLKSAKTALKLANEPDRFLSTVQIGITLIGILTGIYSGNQIAVDLTEAMKSWGVSSTYAFGLAQGVIVVVVTYLTIIFGELVPKRIGMSMAEKAAKVMAQQGNGSANECSFSNCTSFRMVACEKH